MASKSRSTFVTAILVLVGVIASMVVFTTSQELMSPNSAGLWGLNSRSRIKFPLMRRFDCSAICRKTGYSGYIGGCQCGFTLFTRKRANQPVALSAAADEANPLSYAFNSLEESIANVPSTSDDGLSSVASAASRENSLPHSAPLRSPVASPNSQRMACTGLCERSK